MRHPRAYFGPSDSGSCKGRGSFAATGTGHSTPTKSAQAVHLVPPPEKVPAVAEAKTALSHPSLREARGMAVDVLLEAVTFYKHQLLEYLDEFPDSTPDELVGMLDDDVMGDLPSEEDVLAADPQRFKQMLMEEVPRRRWEQMADMSQRPTTGWMMMWVIGEHVRLRALAELRETFATDDWRTRLIDEMLVV
jgi:hypothetical protein